MTTKEQIVKAMSELPEDADYEEALDRIILLAKIERSRQDFAEGRTISNDEVMKRVQQWLR